MTQIINNFEFYGVLTQYFRWYQVYETDFTPNTIANQLDILHEDIEISSQAGTTKGKKDLPDRLKLFTGWQNAHHVQNFNIIKINENQCNLTANIIYQNIRPDNSKYSYKIFYDTILQINENTLPLFLNVKITPTGLIENFEFNQAYTDNRAKSLIYYYLTLLNKPNSDKQELKSILADSLINHKLLNFNPANISTISKNDKIIIKFMDINTNKNYEWLVANDVNQKFAKIIEIN